MATFTGTSGDDNLTGTSGADVLFGRQGNDTLRGSGGADFLYGGTDADQLYGGAGDDHLDGQSGKDALYGGDGSDTLLAGVGDDRLEGGGGSDLFIVDNTAYSGDDVIVDFGSGDLILTRAKLADSNNDGIITVGSALNVYGGSTVAINNGGTDVTSLKFVGTRQFDSATYFAYASAGATPPTVTVTFSQSARDTSIRFGSPDTVAATATTLVVDSGGNSTSQTLLAFEGLFGDGPGQIPLGATITSASLTLTTVNNSATGATFHRMLADWTEQATWNSLGSGVQFGTEAVATADFDTGAVRNGAAAYDVTASLQAWLAGADSAQEANAANNGWLVATDATDAWHFFSSEGGSGMPVLTVTFSTTGTPPPPDGGGGSNIVLTLDPSFRENVAGAVVGTLSVADSPPGESYVFAVTDARFQVLGNQLTLREGVRLDFERTPTVPLSVTATDSGGQPITDTVRATVADVPETRFAAFGDYGNHAGTPLVAQLADALGVDFIITTGDNVYGAEPIDDQIGRYYSEYIGNYKGAYGPGSPTNLFFPSLGNHEYSDDAGGTNASAYLSYFTLPGNERYYDFVRGPVHFFAISSNSQEPDGKTSSSVQAQWLKDGLANSASPYNIVYFHHPPFSSGANHGSTAVMQWPFEQWGATAVLSGHDHTYERILRDADGDHTILPYFVTGLGGNTRYDFGSIVAGSAARYNDNWGTMLIQASDESITFEFVSVAGGGMGKVIDSYTIELASLATSLDQPGTSTTMLAEDFSADWRGSVQIADNFASEDFPDWPAPAPSESGDWKEAAYSLPQLPDFGTYGFSIFSWNLSYLYTTDFLV